MTGQSAYSSSPVDLAETNQSGSGPAASTDVGLVVFPLTPLQEALWRADLQAPGTTVANGAFRHELTGPLDAELWQRAWNRLICRHEALRGAVQAIDGAGYFAIADEAAIELVRRDLRTLSPAVQTREIERISDQDARFQFDISQAPLLRVGLTRVGNDRYIQTLTLHHLVSDGWSIALLIDELLAIYAALCDKRVAVLPALEIQFGDYLAWLAEKRRSLEYLAQADYWRRQLAGCARTDLEPDRDQAGGSSPDSEIISLSLPPDLVAGLKLFGEARRSTLFVTSLTGLIALLWAETGRGDITVGSPVAVRDRPETERVVGSLLNYVLIRVNVAATMSLDELARSVREVVLEAIANQNVPFGDVCQLLADHGSPLPDPAYSISFIAQRAFAGGSAFVSTTAEVSMRTLPSKSAGALYDLSFFLVQREDGWRLSLDYACHRFSKARAATLLDDLARILGIIAVDPDVPLSQLPRLLMRAAPVTVGKAVGIAAQ